MLTRRTFLTDVLVALAATGCSRSDRAQDHPPDGRATSSSPPTTSTPRLKLTAARNNGPLCYASWLMAAERGFFAEEGLDVEFLEQLRPEGSHAHGLVSEVLKGPTGPVPTDLMLVEYPALTSMASGALPYHVVAGEHSGCRQIVCRANSTVQSAADLRGKRVGAWPQADTLLFDMMIGSSRPVVETVTWVRSPNMNDPEAEVEWARRELTAGRIEGYVGPDPIGEILNDEGVARRVASNTWTPPYSGWYCCMLAVRTELLDRHPGLAKSFTRAIRRAAAYVKENSLEVVAAGVKAGHFPPSTPQQLSAKLLQEYVWTTTGRIQEDLARYFELLIDAGRMPATTPPRELVARVYRNGDA